MSETTKQALQALIDAAPDRKTRKAWKRYKKQLVQIERQQAKIDAWTRRTLAAGRLA